MAAGASCGSSSSAGGSVASVEVVSVSAATVVVGGGGRGLTGVMVSISVATVVVVVTATGAETAALKPTGIEMVSPAINRFGLVIALSTMIASTEVSKVVARVDRLSPGSIVQATTLGQSKSGVSAGGASVVAIAAPLLSATVTVSVVRTTGSSDSAKPTGIRSVWPTDSAVGSASRFTAAIASTVVWYCKARFQVLSPSSTVTSMISGQAASRSCAVGRSATAACDAVVLGVSLAAAPVAAAAATDSSGVAVTAAVDVRAEGDSAVSAVTVGAVTAVEDTTVVVAAGATGATGSSPPPNVSTRAVARIAGIAIATPTIAHGRQPRLGRSS